MTGKHFQRIRVTMERGITDKIISSLITVSKGIFTNLLFHRSEFDYKDSRGDALLITGFYNKISKFPKLMLYEHRFTHRTNGLRTVQATQGLVRVPGFFMWVHLGRQTIDTDRRTGLERKLSLTVFRWHRTKLENLLLDWIPLNPESSLLFSSWKDGSFTKSVRRSVRTMTQLAVSPDIQEQLFGDALSWWKRVPQYRNLNIPIRRGYHLLGPPGSGKTSLVPALAEALGFSNVLSVSLNGLSDTDLQDMIGEIPQGSILLIEDADSFASMREENDSQAHDDGKSVSRSGVLNFLGGIQTLDEVVVVITSNSNPFSDAAVRNGRIERQVYVGELSGDTIYNYLKKVFPDREITPVDKIKPMLACDMQDILTSYCDDPVELNKALIRGPVKKGTTNAQRARTGTTPRRRGKNSTASDAG